MRKKILLNAILFVLFVAGLAVLLNKADFILNPKTYSGVQEQFARTPRDSIDMVFIGTSHQFCSIDPDLLYRDYGVNSFMLATSAQTVPMSYYAAMEAIELQHPDTIVFEACYCANGFIVVNDEMSHYFFDGMPMCEAKKLGIEDLIEEEQRIYYQLPIGLFHTRWKELTEADFSITEHTSRGGMYFENITANTDIPLISPEEKKPMTEDMEKYLDMLVDLCEENGVKLIMYTAPYNTMSEGDDAEGIYNSERIFNYIADFAEERNVPYYNLFYEIEEIGLSNETDWMDRQHLNCYGQEKLTRYMMEKGYLE